MVMTHAFHAGSTGSNPVRGTARKARSEVVFLTAGLSRRTETAHGMPTRHPGTWLRTILAVGIVFVLGGLNAELTHAATLHPVVSCRAPNLTPTKAIDCYWPRSSRATAHRVAECESTASASERVAQRRRLGRWAADYATGTHWGIFQLGGAERKAHGRYVLGSPARVQVRSAVSLFDDRGWVPWEASRKRCWGRR